MATVGPAITIYGAIVLGTAVGGPAGAVVGAVLGMMGGGRRSSGRCGTRGAGSANDGYGWSDCAESLNQFEVKYCLMKPTISKKVLQILVSPAGALCIALYVAMVFWLFANPTILALRSRIPELYLLNPVFVGVQTYVIISGANLLLGKRLRAHLPSTWSNSNVQFWIIAARAFIGCIASVPLLMNLVTAPTGILFIASDPFVAFGSFRRRYLEWFKTLAIAGATFNLIMAITVAILRFRS